MLRTMLKVLKKFSELTSKASLCFKEHELDLLFLTILTIKQIASCVL